MWFAAHEYSKNKLCTSLECHKEKIEIIPTIVVAACKPLNVPAESNRARRHKKKRNEKKLKFGQNVFNWNIQLHH